MPEVIFDFISSVDIKTASQNVDSNQTVFVLSPLSLQTFERNADRTREILVFIFFQKFLTEERERERLDVSIFRNGWFVQLLPFSQVDDTLTHTTHTHIQVNKNTILFIPSISSIFFFSKRVFFRIVGFNTTE